MDIFLVIGIILGLVAVITGLLIKGVGAAILINGEAVVVILVGTMAAVMNSFPKSEFLKIPKLFGILFKDKNKEDPVTLINEIVDIAQSTRKNGLLSLEERAQKLDNKFMKKGLEMIVDGNDPEYIRQVLTDEIEAMQERHKTGASIFSTAGGASPTLGVMGAAIGLIGALGNLSDTEKLGESIASAFIATLYGIFFGYIVWHPFSSRLKRKSLEEVAIMELILEGILAIQEGKNPKSIQAKLLSMLSPKDRLKFEETDTNNKK
ncbi:chemotaxis protein MotA [Clostridium sp. USBA 49]|uniref:flagellar motor stator protein MotA n=1 Tax=Clostridium TaxID=1485 RepID=UPI00099A39B6|nr:MULTISPECIES: flagellar motor stator protein MotA [Clostridium]SKA85492.1 chemotaxis protein MotA [Clostridium sp. USBA 49]